MKAPTTDQLCETFDLTTAQAELVRALAKAASGDGPLEDLIDTRPELENTERYVRSLYSSPYDSDCWRVTVALHAINDLVDGYGVEGFGPERSGDYAPAAYEYVNFGDTYATTLIYDRDANELTIGDWGSIAESIPSCSYCGKFTADEWGDPEPSCQGGKCESCSENCNGKECGDSCNGWQFDLEKYYDPGCYGDGASGYQHVRDRLADIVIGHKIGDSELVSALRGSMSDDDSETDEALDQINDLVPSGSDCTWYLHNGDLIFGEDEGMEV